MRDSRDDVVESKHRQLLGGEKKSCDFYSASIRYCREILFFYKIQKFIM